MKFKMGFGAQTSAGQLDTLLQPQPLSSFYTKAVCKQCNTGWMSRLENVAQKLLSPLVGTEWPANEKTILQTLFLHSADLTLWLLKTAATLGEKMAMRVPQFVIEQLRLQRIPEWVYSDIAFSEQAGHRLVISNSWNVVKDGEVTVRKNEHSFRLTWQIRHLTLRVSHFPFTERHQLKPRYPVRVYPKFMVPPDYALDGVAKRSYAYQNVEQLERETTYVIRDGPDPLHPLNWS
ncbi:MAG: hypothetical protein ACLQU3_09260 [Limisphaerales bacterium]